MEKIILVTGNMKKLISARQFLKPHGIEVDNVKMDTTEIQSDSIEEIAAYSAKEASEKLKCDVLKNDTGFFIESLNGFPGAYTHQVMEEIGTDGILKLMRGIKERNAYFKEAFAYCEYGKEPVVFTAITKGKLATRKSGKYGLRIDPIFIPEGYTKTMAHYDDDKRFSTWNTKVFDEIAEYIKGKK
jgi:XTP/dITP diphosphohydrolase